MPKILEYVALFRSYVGLRKGLRRIINRYMANILKDTLDERGTLVIDGAMGTQLFARGLMSGDSPEPWNVDHPDRVQEVHDAYVAAGSDIILTNTFGGNANRLKLHNLQDRVHEFNKAGAEVARRSADAVDRTVLVAGSMGPTGDLFEPMGDLNHALAVESFTAQAQGLVDGGADILWIETMSDLAEVRAAVEAALSVGGDVPVCTTLSFDTKGRSMMGVTPRQAVREISEMGVTAIGGNCGNGLDEIEGVINQMHDALPDAILIAKANAGIPKWIGDELYYDGNPQLMAEYAQRARSLGAKIIGGCCGSGPEHIEAMAAALSPEASPITVARGFEIPDEKDAPPQEGGRTRSGRRRRSAS